MSSTTQKTEALTKPAVSFLRGRSLIPLLIIIQLLIYFIGPKFWGISADATTGYMLLMWIPLLYFHMTGDFTISDLEDMTNKKCLISEFVKGKKYGLEGRSLEVQFIWFFMGFSITVFILLLTIINFNWPTTQPIFQSQAMPLIIFNLTLVTVSETVCFHGVLPGVIEKKLKKIKGVHPHIQTATRYGISQGLFALFHISAYWDSPNLKGALITSFLFGILFLSVREHKFGGLAPTMGLHAGWNLIVTGALIGVYAGV